MLELSSVLASQHPSSLKTQSWLEVWKCDSQRTVIICPICSGITGQPTGQINTCRLYLIKPVIWFGSKVFLLVDHLEESFTEEGKNQKLARVLERKSWGIIKSPHLSGNLEVHPSRSVLCSGSRWTWHMPRNCWEAPQLCTSRKQRRASGTKAKIKHKTGQRHSKRVKVLVLHVDKFKFSVLHQTNLNQKWIAELGVMSKAITEK